MLSNEHIEVHGFPDKDGKYPYTLFWETDTYGWHISDPDLPDWLLGCPNLGNPQAILAEHGIDTFCCHPEGKGYRNCPARTKPQPSAILFDAQGKPRAFQRAQVFRATLPEGIPITKGAEYVVK